MQMEQFYREMDQLFHNGDTDAVELFLKQALSHWIEIDDTGVAAAVLNEVVGYYRSVGRHVEAISAGEHACIGFD